ncbi:MAG TPA: 1-acyl-sn-glycerol-3-phosphate acyltransferase [Candidatus Angelobacter sp.]|jgi:acyl-[acyl-carrier-protein]-phospholipid O-acyltransferase/long-chain-fatty-acid--[acyl-carrier-protein] ligase
MSTVDLSERGIMPTREPTHEDSQPRQSLLVRLVTALPNWGLRVLLWFLSRIVYRVKLLGKENIPQKGGALLVSNHMSFVDVVLISAAANRPVRFLIFNDVYNIPFIKPFALLMRAIPIPTEMRPRDIVRSFRIASDAIRAGELVCVFAEGHITRTGSMLPFRKGMERIVHGLDAPVIPVNLHGVWGSIFSYERERFLWKAPRRMPYRVTVSFGPWLPSTASAAEVRRSVQALQAPLLKQTALRVLRSIERWCTQRDAILSASAWAMRVSLK